MEQIKKNILILGSALNSGQFNASFNRANEFFKLFIRLNHNPYLLITKITQTKKSYKFITENDRIKIYNGNIEDIINKLKIDCILSLSYDLRTIKFLFNIAKRQNIKFVYDYVEDHVSKMLNNIFSFNLKIFFKNINELLFHSRFLHFFKRNEISLLVISKKLKSKLDRYGLSSNLFPLILTDNYNFANKVRSNSFGMCGSLTHSKDDIFRLLLAFSKIKKKEKSLYLYGNPTRSTKIIINIILKLFHLKQNVIIKSHLPYNELIKELSTIEFLILTKRKTKQNYYNLPTKLVDYLYAKRPVILPNYGETENWFKDNYNCLKYRIGNTNDLAKKMEIALEMDQNSKIKIIKNFIELKNFFNNYKNILSKII